MKFLVFYVDELESRMTRQPCRWVLFWISRSLLGRTSCNYSQVQKSPRLGFGFVWTSYTFIYIIFIHFHLPYLKTFLFIWLHLCTVTVIFLLHLLFLPSSAFTSFHSLLFILGSSTFHIHLSLSQYPFLHTVIFIWPSLTFWKCNFIFVNLHSLLSMFSDLHVFSCVLTQLN